jgi:ArsR family transcriptional regulator, lead/cadmium/zinc/bismuth-responsive transcriptional repressor
MVDVCEGNFVDKLNVAEAKKQMLSSDDLERISDFFKILGDQGRLKICLALSKQSLCVCDLSALLEMSDSAVSHQLRLLKQMRILRSEKKGKRVYYHLLDQHIFKIIQNTKEHLEE